MNIDYLARPTGAGWACKGNGATTQGNTTAAHRLIRIARAAKGEK